jgi:HSP20 family protein
LARAAALVAIADRPVDIICPMDSSRTVRLHWLHSTLGDVTYRLRFSHFTPHAWRPAINAYRCETCIRICVDLAGVAESDIDLTIKGRTLSIRGVREVPEPGDDEEGAVQMIAMEIDYGPFERTVQLPDEVDVNKVHAEQREGFLWIHLPLKKS